MAPKGKKKTHTKGTGKGSRASNKTTDDNGGKVNAGKLLGGNRKESQQVNVRHILCEKVSRLPEAVNELQWGYPFDEVATEYSEDKASVGGSLGWKRRGDIDPIFAAAAFEIVVSTLEKPVWHEVESGLGYHLLMIEGKRLG